MELKDIYIDKKGRFRLKHYMFKLADYEIILTKEEAKKWGADLKKNPKGYYTEVDGVRVPINIDEK